MKILLSDGATIVDLPEGTPLPAGATLLSNEPAVAAKPAGGALTAFLASVRKAPGYLPTGRVEMVDANDIAYLNGLKRRPFVADVTSTYNEKTTTRTKLILGQDEILVDRSTKIALSGHNLTKAVVDLNTITLTVWEPTPELLAKGYKNSVQASFDFEVKD